MNPCFAHKSLRMSVSVTSHPLSSPGHTTSPFLSMVQKGSLLSNTPVRGGTDFTYLSCASTNATPIPAETPRADLSFFPCASQVSMGSQIDLKKKKRRAPAPPPPLQPPPLSPLIPNRMEDKEEKRKSATGEWMHCAWGLACWHEI